MDSETVNHGEYDPPSLIHDRSKWRPSRFRRPIRMFVCCLVFCLATAPALAQRAVALELVLAVDTSASVDAREFWLQMQGIARAFRDPGIVTAIQAAGSGGIAVLLLQWAGPGDQSISAGWDRVHDKASAARFASRVASAKRAFRGSTSLDDMLRTAITLFTSNGYAGRRRVIDVSGDGRDNSGNHADWMRDRAVAAGITVNGLAVLSADTDTETYYRRHVIGGADAFLITAAGYQDFTRAMRAKLMREIMGDRLALGPP